MVDPLDGTKEFIKRNGEFTVNIALIKQGAPVLGVIYVPVTRELYYADVQKKVAYKTLVETRPYLKRRSVFGKGQDISLPRLLIPLQEWLAADLI